MPIPNDNGHEHITSCLFLLLQVNVPLEGRSRKGGKMPLPQTFKDFIPSVGLAREYREEWENPASRDYRCYQEITRLFTNHNAALVGRCDIVYMAYDHFHRNRAQAAASCITGIKNFAQRVQKGDISIIEEMRLSCGNVFSVMFCHHTSTEKYFGFTKPVREMLVKLNTRDHFYNSFFTEAELRDYPTFHIVMQQLKSHYLLKNVSNLELDIMLRLSNNLN